MLICFYVYTRLYICNMFSFLRSGGNEESLSLYFYFQKLVNAVGCLNSTIFSADIVVASFEVVRHVRVIKHDSWIFVFVDSHPLITVVFESD